MFKEWIMKNKQKRKNKVAIDFSKKSRILNLLNLTWIFF